MVVSTSPSSAYAPAENFLVTEIREEMQHNPTQQEKIRGLLTQLKEQYPSLYNQLKANTESTVHRAEEHIGTFRSGMGPSMSVASFETVSPSLAIQSLQARLDQDEFAPEGLNTPNGIAGPETRKAILSYMTLEPDQFRRMINSMYGSDLSELSDPTMIESMSVLEKNTGISITEGELVNFIVIERAHAERTEYEVWKSKALTENIAEYATLPDTVEGRAKKNKLLLVITKKLQNENIIIAYDEASNGWRTENNDGTLNSTYKFSPEQLRFMAFSGTISTSSSIDSVTTAPDLNQIFDSVVTKFKLKRTDGTPWAFNDMQEDPSGYVTGQDKNRAEVLQLVNAEITKIEGNNKLRTTQTYTKKDNTVWIQRLEIVKGYLSSPDAIDTNTITQVALTASGSTVNNYMADNPELRPVNLTDGIISGQFVDDILKSGIAGPAIIVGIVGMFIALPKWLKYPAYGIIGAMILNGPYKNLVKKWGLDTQIREMMGDAGYSPTTATAPGGAPTTNAVQKFWSKMGGVDEQFSHGYAIIRQQYEAHGNGRGKERFPESRLELLFKHSAQDGVFTGLDATVLEANIENPKAVFSPSLYKFFIDRGLTDNEMTLYIKFILKAKGNGDKTVADILSEGKFDKDKIVSSITFVEGEDDFNRTVAGHIQSLDGRGKDTPGTTEEERGTRGRVETILATTLPNIFTYQSTDSQELDTIIIDLGKVSVDPKTKAEDKVIIDSIIVEYEAIKKSLEKVEGYNEWKSKAHRITTTRGTGVETAKKLYNDTSNGLAWATGMPVSLLGTIDLIHPDEIDAIIAEGEKLVTTNAGNSEILEKIHQELFELQNRKSFLLANLALDTDVPAIRDGLQAQAAASRAKSLAMKPKVYKEYITEYAKQIADIKIPQGNINGYYQVLSENSRVITSLASIVQAGDVDGKAQQVLSESTTVYVSNLQKYANDTVKGPSSRLGRLTATINNPASTRAQLATARVAYDTLRAEILAEGVMQKARNYLYEGGIIDNGQVEEYTDLFAVIQTGLAKAGTSISLYDSDLKTQFDELEAKLENRGVEAATSIDQAYITSQAPVILGSVATIVSTNTFIKGVEKVQKDISALPDGAGKEGAQKRLNDHVSVYITKLSEQAKTAASPEELDKVITLYDKLDGIERGEDGFDDAAKEKVKHELLSVTMEKAPQEIVAPLKKLTDTMHKQGISIDRLVSLIKNPNTKMSELLRVIDAEIKVQNNILSAMPDDTVQKQLLDELKGSKNALLLALEGSLGLKMKQWLEKQGVNIMEYLYSLARA